MINILINKTLKSFHSWVNLQQIIRLQRCFEELFSTFNSRMFMCLLCKWILYLLNLSKLKSINYCLVKLVFLLNWSDKALGSSDMKRVNTSAWSERNDSKNICETVSLEVILGSKQTQYSDCPVLFMYYKAVLCQQCKDEQPCNLAVDLSYIKYICIKRHS